MIHHQDSHMTVSKIVVGALDNNAYVVACRSTGEAVMVDAADDPERLVDAVDGLDLRMILTTHGHGDHVQGVGGLVAATGTRFMIHAEDEALAGRSSDRPLEPGPIRVGDLTIEAMHTPGHTPGSMCFAVGGVVFTGDTLFPGGPGKTSGGDDFDEIIANIENHLFVLDDSTIVMPGHGRDTTIGQERPQLEGWIARRW
jgi:glyoxylase-like metal-dependent hydrolase (beta-lactamase superfamily II)